MVRRIIASAFTVLGVSTVLLWFLLLFRIWKWTLLIPGHDPNLVILAMAILNLAGLTYLILNRRYHPRWLIIAGVAGHSLSLCVIGFSTLGYLFLEYFFRM